MIPVQITNYGPQALAFFTDMFKNRPNLNNWMLAHQISAQEVEVAMFSLLTGRDLATCVGDVLDKFGSIVGILRNGLSDAAYRQAIYLQIQVNKSDGTTRALQNIALATLGGDIYYQEFYPRAFELDMMDIQSPQTTWLQLKTAKPAGVRGLFGYSTWTDNDTFIWGSVYGGTPGAEGFNTVYGSSLGTTGKLIGVFEL